MTLWTRLWQAFFPPAPTPKRPAAINHRGPNKPAPEAGRKYTPEQWEVLKTVKCSRLKKLARAWGRSHEALYSARLRARMEPPTREAPAEPAPLRAVRGGESHADGLY